MDETSKPEENKVPETAIVPAGDLQPEAEVDDDEIVSEETDKVRSTKLDQLPEHVKKDFDLLILQNIGRTSIKKILMGKYKDEALLNADLKTYGAYIRIHKSELLQRAEANRKLMEASGESLKEIQQVVDATLDTSSTYENKKELLLNLLKSAQARYELIKLEQNKNGWLNPQLESIAGSYLREQRAIIESLLRMQEELQKDVSLQFQIDLDRIMYQWANATIEAYRKVHGSAGIDQFDAEVRAALKGKLSKFVSDSRADSA